MKKFLEVIENVNEKIQSGFHWIFDNIYIMAGVVLTLMVMACVAGSVALDGSSSSSSYSGENRTSTYNNGCHIHEFPDLKTRCFDCGSGTSCLPTENNDHTQE